jgi:hypothetical protein
MRRSKKSTQCCTCLKPRLFDKLGNFEAGSKICVTDLKTTRGLAHLYYPYIISDLFRIDFIRHPLFRFVIYFMDADRHALITTHTDVNLDEQYVRANREYLRSELIPFVAREINAVTGMEAINIQNLMDLLLDAFENPNQKRDQLFNYLKSIGVDHPRTLYKNIQEFASANQSLLLYDSNSCYKYVYIQDNDNLTCF